MSDASGPILCATDLGESGATALAWAAALARTSSAPLVLLHVDGAEYDTPSVPERIQAAANALTGRLDARRKAHEEALNKTIANLDIACELKVATGRPWEATLAVAKARNARTIVVGPHSSGLGSTARRVLTHSKVPVLVARGAVPRDLEGAHWVIGVPFEDDVPRIVKNVEAIASSSSGRITLVRALMPMGAAALSPLPMTTYEEQHALHARHLDEIASKLRCQATVHVASGEPHVVLEEASENAIVGVAAHERGVLERFFLGSVTERLLRKTQRCVYVEPAEVA